MIDKLIDSVAGIKEVADDDRSIEIIIHRFVAFLFDFLSISLCDLAVSLSLDMVELAYSIKEALHTAPASLESFIGEVHG